MQIRVHVFACKCIYYFNVKPSWGCCLFIKVSTTNKEWRLAKYGSITNTIDLVENDAHMLKYSSTTTTIGVNKCKTGFALVKCAGNRCILSRLLYGIYVIGFYVGDFTWPL